MSTVAATATSYEPALQRPALETNQAARAVLLAVTTAGKRIVAVGERGIVIFSDDDGRSWIQARVPVSVTLTGVHFVDEQTGWTTGHGGVVLRSTDAGETWEKQLDGVVAAELALEHAETRLSAWKAENADNGSSIKKERSQHDQSEGQDESDALLSGPPPSKSGLKKRLDRALSDAQWFVSSGPDKPFFDVHFWDEKNGFVVGAFGLIFGTDDGGNSWQPWMLRMDNIAGNHLYNIRVIGGHTYIAGERGAVFVTDNSGVEFEPVPTPFDGSYFAILPATDNGAALLLGLKGHFFRSDAQRNTWREITEKITNSAFNGLRTDNGAIVLAMESGNLLVSHDDGENFEPVTPDRSYPFAALVETKDGALVVVGVGGAQRVAQSLIESADE